jgi:hypothetical protein
MENPNWYAFNLPIAVNGIGCMRTFYGGHKRTAQYGNFAVRHGVKLPGLCALIEPSPDLHPDGIGKTGRLGGKWWEQQPIGKSWSS